MDLYDSKTKTGWKQIKQWHGGYGWVYMENDKRKVPGTSAWRILKGAAKSVKDSPIFQEFSNSLNDSMTMIGENEVRKGELAIEASKAISENVKVPDLSLDANTYHPHCLETFGELCTIKEYETKMLQRTKEQLTDHWSAK